MITTKSPRCCWPVCCAPRLWPMPPTMLLMARAPSPAASVVRRCRPTARPARHQAPTVRAAMAAVPAHRARARASMAAMAGPVVRARAVAPVRPAAVRAGLVVGQAAERVKAASDFDVWNQGLPVHPINGPSAARLPRHLPSTAPLNGFAPSAWPDTTRRPHAG